MKLLNKFKFSLPPLPTPPPQHAPARGTLLLLAALVGIAVATHFFLGHIVLVAYGLAVWALKTAAIRASFNPPRWLVMVLTIASFGLVMIFYGGWNGQKAGISFLVLLAALKFLESQSLRDYYLVCLILLFLASASFLFNSSLSMIVAVVVYTLLIVALMLRLSDPHDSRRFMPLVNAGKIFSKALPLAVLLFFFFPRISGNFGFIPSLDDASDGQLNDSLVAGDFANSAFSYEPAFRVKFDGDVPPNPTLYWRSKVMVNERNFAWEVRRPDANVFRAARALPPRQSANRVTEYEIIHNPSSDDYLPYLDYALNPEKGIQLPDSSVFRFQKEAGAFAYRGIATAKPNLDAPNRTLDPANRAELLATQSKPSPRVQALLSSWQATATSDDELITLVLNYMVAEKFEYTLTPPSLGADPLDSFLFDTRSGYCEHYASAFTILMRWLGVPARVVIGFQGGTPNLVGDYLQVRFSDAHAWSEVWINGQWQRVDPTTASSLGEQRISQGMQALLSLWQGGSWSPDPSLSNYLNPSGYDLAWRRLRDTLDNLSYQWDKWVINYNFETQKKLIENLGFKHRNSLTVLISILAIGIAGLMLFYFWQLIPKAIKRDEAQQVYLQFLSRLKPFQLVKERAETPLEFAQRASLALPSQANNIQQITDLYNQLRYGKQTTDVNELSRQVKQFKPKKNPKKEHK